MIYTNGKTYQEPRREDLEYSIKSKLISCIYVYTSNDDEWKRSDQKKINTLHYRIICKQLRRHFLHSNSIDDVRSVDGWFLPNTRNNRHDWIHLCDTKIERERESPSTTHRNSNQHPISKVFFLTQVCIVHTLRIGFWQTSNVANGGCVFRNWQRR